MTFNWYMIFIAALVPLIVGFVWYNPKVFGNAWMTASGMTPEKAKGASMLKTFALTYLFSLFAAVAMVAVTIHQTHMFSILANDMQNAETAPAAMSYMAGFLEKYGSTFRTFKHGAFHGTLMGILLALPITTINALFEMRGFKYIAINAGFWIVSLALMGGLICGFV
jgi:hypothetical protein